MQELKANTAVDVLIGPHMDETDGITAMNGLTIEDEHVLLSKLGQALTAKTDANDAGNDADGYYNCPLDGTDTNSEGTLTLITHMTGALPVRHDYMVLSQAAWDSKYAAKDTGLMDVHVKTIEADAITPASIIDSSNFVIQALSITNQLDAGTVLVDGTTTLTGNVSFAGTFDIVGAATAGSVSIDAGFDVVGALTAGSVSIDSTFDIVGALTAGSVSIDSTFDVVGLLSAGSVAVDTTTILSGNVTLSGTLGVGATTLSSLTVTDNLLVSGQFNVTGTSTLTGAVAFSGGLTSDITGTLSTVSAVTAISANGITNASFHTDVGSTAIGTNRIGTATDKALDASMVDEDGSNAPTANSLKAYVNQTKKLIVNQMAITEANGNTTVLEDDDSTGHISVNAAFDSDSGTTTRLLLE